MLYLDDVTNAYLAMAWVGIGMSWALSIELRLTHTRKSSQKVVPLLKFLLFNWKNLLAPYCKTQTTKIHKNFKGHLKAIAVRTFVEAVNIYYFQNHTTKYFATSPLTFKFCLHVEALWADMLWSRLFVLDLSTFDVSDNQKWRIQEISKFQTNKLARFDNHFVLNWKS